MRIVDIISETPETDRLMRQEAVRLYKSLFNQRSRPLTKGSLFAINEFGRRYAQPVAYIPTSYKDLAIGLVAGLDSPALITGPSNMPRNLEYLIGFPMEDDTRGLAVDYRPAMAKLNRKTVNDLIFTLGKDPENFVHEFTHYRDQSKAGNTIKANYNPNASLEDDPEDDKKYFNDTLERNAFFNMALIKLDKAGPEYFQVPFQQWLARVIKNFRPDFIKALDLQNRKRLINRLYMIWAEKQTSPLNKDTQNATSLV